MQELAPPENKRHFAGLDGLRGVAVLMVLFQHYVPVQPGARWMWTGVRIFFVLSGFLITGILYDTRNAERRWSVFYWRRALRIFPLYYGVLLLGVALYPFFRWMYHPSWILWPFYLQNYARFIWPADIPLGTVDHLRSLRFSDPPFFIFYGHFWSLAIEEQFYLVWPLVVFAVKRRETLMKICVWVVVLSPLARLIACLTLSGTLLDAGFEERFTLLQCDSLLIGAFFALWMRGEHPDLSRIARWILWSVAAVTLGAEVYTRHFEHVWVAPNYGRPVFASIGYTCVNFAAVGIVLLAIDPRTWLSKLLGNKALRYIGTISYGFYVFHDMPHKVYDKIAHRLLLHLSVPHLARLLPAIIAVIATTLLATLSFYGFERPFLRLKRRFTVGEVGSA